MSNSNSQTLSERESVTGEQTCEPPSLFPVLEATSVSPKPMAEASGGGKGLSLAYQLGSKHRDQGCDLPNGQGGLVSWESRASFFFFLPGSAYGSWERESSQTSAGRTLETCSVCVLILSGQHSVGCSGKV